ENAPAKKKKKKKNAAKQSECSAHVREDDFVYVGRLHVLQSNPKVAFLHTKYQNDILIFGEVDRSFVCLFVCLPLFRVCSYRAFPGDIVAVSLYSYSKWEKVELIQQALKIEQDSVDRGLSNSADLLEYQHEPEYTQEQKESDNLVKKKLESIQEIDVGQHLSGFVDLNKNNKSVLSKINFLYPNPNDYQHMYPRGKVLAIVDPLLDSRHVYGTLLSRTQNTSNVLHTFVPFDKRIPTTQCSFQRAGKRIYVCM
ncbi:hypothetical protein RFI_16833, partial [Reticulomyxa filosa]